ncbi:hypothetical protein Tco_0262135 [Tanacetum coccineum]
MDAPPSPNYVFNFLEKEEFEKDPQEDPEEEPEEELEVDAEEDVPPTATPLVGSPITLPPLSDSLLDYEGVAFIVANGTHEMPPLGSTFKDLSHEVKLTSGVEGRVTRLEDKDQEKMDKMEKIEKHLETLETNYALVLSDRYRTMSPRRLRRTSVEQLIADRVAEAIAKT